jgi:hypothetical protein
LFFRLFNDYVPRSDDIQRCVCVAEEERDVRILPQ